MFMWDCVLMVYMGGIERCVYHLHSTVAQGFFASQDSYLSYFTHQGLMFMPLTRGLLTWDEEFF